MILIILTKERWHLWEMASGGRVGAVCVEGRVFPVFERNEASLVYAAFPFYFSFRQVGDSCGGEAADLVIRAGSACWGSRNIVGVSKSLQC